MISTHKKKQSKTRLLNQLDNFDQDSISGKSKKDRRENVTVIESTAYQEYTVDKSDSNKAVKEKLVNVKIFEKCFIESIDREMGNIVDRVEDKIQNAILTAIDCNITPKSDLAVRSLNGSSGPDATSVLATFERGKHIGITASFEKYPKSIINYMC